MKASVEKLRWGLAAAALLLLLAVAASLGYGHYRQIRKWRDTLRRLNLHGPHETTGFTYSSSPKDRTSYKVRAARVIEHGDGKWSMYDVALTLYSKTSSDEDHVYASDIEYDQNSGVARAVGPVHMDLQIAGAMKSDKSALPLKTSHDADGDSDEIHVQTSGLVYLHKLGVAATDEPAQFSYKDMQCTSKGAEFDSTSSQLHLLADVVLNGSLQGAPLVVHAAKADLDRDQNQVVATHAVALSKGRTLAAGIVTAHMRKDGSLERAEAGGGVSMISGTRRLDAAKYAGTFSTASIPQSAKLSGNIVAVDSNQTRPTHGQADELDAAFDTRGNVSTLDATGHAIVTAVERRPGIADLHREMHGDRMLATFVTAARAGRARSHLIAGSQPGSGAPQLKELHVMGAASAMGDSMAAGGAQKTMRIHADDLDALFAGDAKKPALTHIFGHGHSLLEQDAPQGEKQTTASDQIEASFLNASDVGSADHSSEALAISSAIETGHVVLHTYPATKPGNAPQLPSMATGERAVYERSTAKLTLSGSANASASNAGYSNASAAHFTQGGTMLSAAVIVIDQQTEDAAASGNVFATLANAPTSSSASATTSATTAKPAVVDADEQQATHVAAAHATLVHASQVAQFYGAAHQPARLWQGASQVQAATLTFDQKKRTLAARPAPGALVHAVFAGASGGGGHTKAEGTAPEVVRVAAATMDYDDVRREADFTGKVQIESPTAQAQAQRGVAWLSDAAGGAKVGGTSTVGSGAKVGSTPALGGSLKRIVLSDNVHLEQQGRTGTGSQLVYTADDGTYLLTGTPGKPPHIVDPQQGNVTGATLLFHGPDSTIVVNGSAPAQANGRVRTEVEVRGK
jgi:lipopolysaccharide export system protein LptA